MSARSTRLAVLVAAILGAVAIGAGVVWSPELLHVDLDLSLDSLFILAASLALCALVLMVRSLGLFLLLAFVYLNLSQVLVRYHDLPSLLQMLLVPLVLVAWAGRQPAERHHLFQQRLTWLLAGYVLLLFVSTALARDRALADARVVEMLKTLVLYLLIPLLVSSLALLRAALWTVLAAGGALGTLGVWQVATNGFDNEFGGLARIKMAQIYGDVFEPRIAGPLGDPNFFAQIQLVLVPVALWLAWGERHLGRRALALALGAIVLAATVLSYSRGAALAVGLLLVLAFLQHGIRPRTVLAALALGAVVFVALPAGFRERLTTIQEMLPGKKDTLHPDSSFQKRKLFMRVAWRMFLYHPLLGVGAANYSAHFDEHAKEVGSEAREYVDPQELHFPHNLYLEIAAETGVVGLSTFAAAVGTAFLYLRRARLALLARGQQAPAGWIRGLELALLGYLVSSLFLHGHFARYLWLWFGLAAAAECLCAAEHESVEPPAGSPALARAAQATS